MVENAEKINQDRFDNFTEQELLDFLKVLDKSKLNDRIGDKTVLTLAAEKKDVFEW